MKRKRIASTGALMLPMVLLTLAMVVSIEPVPVAQAGYDSASAGSRSDRSKPPQHCILSSGAPLQCFDSEAEALYVASGGVIVLRPGQTSAALSDDELFGPESTVRSILYEHANYGGATLTLYGDGCYGGNNMPNGWNDVTSSVRTDSCGITLYEHYNFTGQSLCIGYPGTSYVGSSMNDKASSWSIP